VPKAPPKIENNKRLRYIYLKSWHEGVDSSLAAFVERVDSADDQLEENYPEMLIAQRIEKTERWIWRKICRYR